MYISFMASTCTRRCRRPHRHYRLRLAAVDVLPNRFARVYICFLFISNLHNLEVLFPFIRASIFRRKNLLHSFFNWHLMQTNHSFKCFTISEIESNATKTTRKSNLRLPIDLELNSIELNWFTMCGTIASIFRNWNFFTHFNRKPFKWQSRCT